jgi:fumarate reductase (CoM/CoB) subunit A
MAERIETDVLVVGAGGAGMRAAYEAHLAGAGVVLAVKGRFGAIGVRGGGATASGFSETGSMRAVGLPQGRPGERLEPDQVYDDILQCGLGMADPKLVRVLVDDALEARSALEDWGMVPTFAEGYGIRTHGVPIVVTLQSLVRRSGITVREGAVVSDLLVEDGTCVGALAVEEQTGNVLAIEAASTILATGGLGRLFSLNFHPSCITGDGYALGFEGGAELFNMEFHQIFIGTIAPTINLVHSWMWESYPRLKNARGEEFLTRYVPAGATVKECVDQRRQHHPFSTRDGLSRYIDLAMVSEARGGRGTPRGGVFVELDAPSYRIRPELVEWYRYRGIQWDRGPVEIGVAHQCCNGGFRIGPDGETTVSGLFAVGEVAAGPHGADRMGGNMLLASQVFGARAGREAARRAAATARRSIGRDEVARVESTLRCPRSGAVQIGQVGESLAALAWNELLLPRSRERLEHALREIGRVRDEDLPRLDIATPLELARAVELRNSLRAAEMVARACLVREESRGGHYRSDFPSQDDGRWLKVVSIGNDDGQMRTDTRAVDPEWTPRSTDMWGRRWG